MINMCRLIKNKYIWNRKFNIIYLDVLSSLAIKNVLDIINKSMQSNKK